MIRAYDEMYVEGTMIRMRDMLEYACLDCGYDPGGFWERGRILAVGIAYDRKDENKRHVCKAEILRERK